MLLLSGPTLAIETPDFEVIGEIEDKVQIRQYDRFTLAKVARGDLKNGSDNQLFRPLADYIFGNNVREEKNCDDGTSCSDDGRGSGSRYGVFLAKSACKSTTTKKQGYFFD